MNTIVIDNIKGSEIADKLKNLLPDKCYSVGIQDLDSRQVILEELISASLRALTWNWTFDIHHSFFHPSTLDIGYSIFCLLFSSLHYQIITAPVENII